MSVTLWYCIKTAKPRITQTTPIAHGLFLVTRVVDGGQPLPGKILAHRGGLCCFGSAPIHILPYNSITVTDSEKSLINVNRKSTMGSTTSHQTTSYVTPNSPNGGSKTQLCRFSDKFRQTSNKSLLQSFTG